MVASTFEVLAEPTRRQILELLRRRPRSVNELVTELGRSQPGTSKHLRVLRDAGFVRAKQEGTRRVYEVRDAPLRELDAWLAPFRKQWAKRLDTLERHLGETEE